MANVPYTPFGVAAQIGVPAPDNTSVYFGNSSNGSIQWDGTNLVLDATSGQISCGSGGATSFLCNKIGLGTSAISNLFWINFVLTTSTGRGALNFDYTYTGAGPQANILSYPTYNGTNANPICYALQTRVRDNSDPSGTGTYASIDSQIGTPATQSITQGTKSFFGLKHSHNQGVGTSNSGGVIRQYGVYVSAYSAYSGVSSQLRYGILSEERVGVLADVGIGLNDTLTATGSTTIIYNSSTTDIDTFVDGTKVLNYDNDGIEQYVKTLKYNNISTVNNGIPAQYATISLTGQTAAITAVTIYLVPTGGTGMYRVSYVASITTAASTSSTLGGSTGFQIKYTDAIDSVVKTSTMVVNTTQNTTATSISGVYCAYCKQSTNLQYLIGYTSTGSTAMVYNLNATVESL